MGVLHLEGGTPKYLEVVTQCLNNLNLIGRKVPLTGVYNGGWPHEPLRDVLHVGSEDPTTGDCVCYDAGMVTSKKVVSEEHTATDIMISIPQDVATQGYKSCLHALKAAEPHWTATPAPKRGEVVRLIGCALREKKNDLAMLLSIENGKILSEAQGEIQEFIDICDFAVGLSRQLEGKVLPSERAGHMLLETYRPLGTVGVVTAFNFPVAVFGWNLAVALVCGNCVLWKPADSTPLISLAIMDVIDRALRDFYYEPAKCGSHSRIRPEAVSLIIPRGTICLCLDQPSELQQLGVVVNPTEYLSHIVCNLLLGDPAINLVSFTGSCEVGKLAQLKVLQRGGKVLLELGGNNASIILKDADIPLAVRASVFAAVGTCGQRCTSLRRLLVASELYEEVKTQLMAAYEMIPLGSPIRKDVLCGPLHTSAATQKFETTVQQARDLGGVVLYGGKVLEANWVMPTIIEVPEDQRHALKQIYFSETFAPILYLFKIRSLAEAITMNNEVPQGLASSLYTQSLENFQTWIGPHGSDCGIVNVNIGPSGAEIGGAFGGEKATGGGREAGSDSWKQYMRRATCTINCTQELPLAQGVKFLVCECRIESKVLSLVG